MKQFIPAWYDSKNWWNSTTQPFYIKRKVTDFDDMISLMTMHSSNNVDYQLIVLNFSPYLRTFLHRYDLYESHYWSVFDEIQGVGHQTPQAIDYRDLSWPEGTEFIFTPFQIQAMTEDLYRQCVLIHLMVITIKNTIFQKMGKKYLLKT